MSSTNTIVDPPAAEELVYDLTFGEEPIGVPASEGYGWPQLELGDAIGPSQRYTVLRKLGFGMSSSTWLARDNEKSNHIAVKVLNGHFTSHLDKTMKCWKPDALRLLSNGTPHCIPLLDEFRMPGRFSYDGEHHCLVSSVYGGTVTSLQKANGYFSLPLQRNSATDLKLDNVFYSSTMSTSDIDILLKKDPSVRNTEDMSIDGPVQSAKSQPLPSITNEEALSSMFVLADLGSALPVVACVKGVATTTTPYRVPELYLAGSWDHRVDIWSFGCLVYEIITANLLFRHIPDQKRNLDPTECILNQMDSCVGPFRAKQLRDSFLAPEYFTSTCELKKGPPEVIYPIEELIAHWRTTDIPMSESKEIGRFIERCLELDPCDRPSAAELLKDPWLRDVD